MNIPAPIEYRLSRVKPVRVQIVWPGVGNVTRMPGAYQTHADASKAVRAHAETYGLKSPVILRD
jgi:hypothetical protein